MVPFKKWIIAACFIPIFLGFSLQMTEAQIALRPPAKISQVEGYRILHQKQIPFRVNRGIQAELEQVLTGIHQMAGMKSFDLPSQYILFRFPHPVALPTSPPGHPIREMIITPPTNLWDPPRLLLKNPQNQWVEYKTNRSLLPLANQLKTQIKPRSH
ncbi:hypothetical protein JOD24_000081 [Kroppenstedtia sanguinis]|uniref:Uncharacterized protein n=1 Tax=Kroppenstedtia sanguinis TaxID=1380684 RepID=A0ABW4C3S4_9BACL